MVLEQHHATRGAALRRPAAAAAEPGDTGGYKKPFDQVGTADDFFYFPTAFPFTVSGNDVIDASLAFSPLPAVAARRHDEHRHERRHRRRHRLRRPAATT